MSTSSDLLNIISSCLKNSGNCYQSGSSTNSNYTSCNYDLFNNFGPKLPSSQRNCGYNSGNYSNQNNYSNNSTSGFMGILGAFMGKSTQSSQTSGGQSDSDSSSFAGVIAAFLGKTGDSSSLSDNNNQYLYGSQCQPTSNKYLSKLYGVFDPLPDSDPYVDGLHLQKTVFDIGNNLLQSISRFSLGDDISDSF